MRAALLGPPAYPRDTGRRLAHQAWQLPDQADVVAARGLQQARAVARQDRQSRRRDVPGFVRLHRLRHLVGRCDAVGEDVVNLVDDRDPVPRQSLREVHLPQRVAAVQRRAGDLADQRIEFAAPAGGRHAYLAKVVVEVDVVVLHPHGVMQLHRDVDELVAQRRQRHQPRIGHLPEQFEAEAVDARHVQHADLQCVHVDLRRLAVQHQRVDAVESFHIPPRSPTNPSLAPIALLRWPRHTTSGKK